MKVQRLIISGATNPLCQSHRYAMFVRSSKTQEYFVDNTRVECHRRKMQIPFVNGIRAMKWPKFKKGAILESHMTTVSWLNGEINQIKTMINIKNAVCCNEQSTIDNKQSLTRSTAEQSAVLGSQYLSSQYMSKNMILKNEPCVLIKNK